MKLTISGILSKAITDPSFSRELKDSLTKTRGYVIGEYQREAPVDKGKLRGSVQSTEVKGFLNNFSYLVGSIATNRNRPYPLYVHEGTGAFKNSSADFPSTGRVRSGESRANRGSGGIRPNRFAKRTKEKVQPKVVRLVVVDINAKINKRVIINGI